MAKVVIVGGKGTAINIAEHILDAQLRYGADVELLGFAVDDRSLGRSINGVPVISGTRDVLDRFPHRDVKFIFALYKPEQMKQRVQLLRSLAIPKGRYFTFRHPSAFVAKSAKVGNGSCILSNVSISNDAAIGQNAIINANVVIEHNSRIGNSSFVAASSCIGAFVTVGAGAFVGLGSQIREKVRLGSYCFVGMGSNVVCDVPDARTVMGNPARVLK